MQALTIRHRTSYRYRRPVAFGEHRMMLRPRDTREQRVVEARLEITPRPANLRLVSDAFGNHVAIAEFDARASALDFESIVSVQHSPLAAITIDPVDIQAEGFETAPYLRLLHADPHDEIGQWVRQSLPAVGSIDTLEFFSRLARVINATFFYRRRDAKGVQPPLETLRSRRGSCRDFALLMIEAARTLGFPARFASGYLATVLDGGAEPADRPFVDEPHGATHAWAQIHIPGAGWVAFDPTAGTVGNASLITVAVVSDPYDALPLHGTYAGAPSDFLGMDVRVSISPGGR